MIAGKRVCLVIPELNEFKEAFESAQLLVRKIPEIDKIFIIDDGSENYDFKEIFHLKQTDEFLDLITRITIHINKENRGAGWSYLIGLAYALEQKFDFVIWWTLIDRGLYISDFQQVLTFLEKGMDFVYGVRWSYRLEGILRRIGLVLHRILFRIQTGQYLLDTTIGLNAYKTDIFRKISIPNREFLYQNSQNKKLRWFWRWGFDHWLLMEACKKNFRLQPIIIRVNPAVNSTIKILGRNSFLSIYAPFFKKVNFSQPDAVAK